MNTRRGKRIKSRRRRRNPVARTLRDPAFRARREANRRRYSRKLKHKPERESDDAVTRTGRLVAGRRLSPRRHQLRQLIDGAQRTAGDGAERCRSDSWAILEREERLRHLVLRESGGQAMDQNERGIIDDLFDRLRRAEGQSGAARSRGRGADRPTRRRTAGRAVLHGAGDRRSAGSARPGAEQGSGTRAPARRARVRAAFSGGLFGGQEAPSPAAPARADRDSGDLGYYRRAGAGGGFLAGAMQTALGVASGFLIADAISALFIARRCGGRRAGARPT